MTISLICSIPATSSWPFFKSSILLPKVLFLLRGREYVLYCKCTTWQSADWPQIFWVPESESKSQIVKGLPRLQQKVVRSRRRVKDLQIWGRDDIRSGFESAKSMRPGCDYADDLGKRHPSIRRCFAQAAGLSWGRMWLYIKLQYIRFGIYMGGLKRYLQYKNWDNKGGTALRIFAIDDNSGKHWESDAWEKAKLGQSRGLQPMRL